MYGDNPIRPPVQSDGTILDVVNIFPTVQGEGPFAGQPSVFIRLGGCNLACTFCDTEFETFIEQPIEKILSQISTAANNETQTRVRQLVVITGGEPFRQNIVPLCEQLIAMGFTVQIETNGTLWRPVPAAVHIVCSPKPSERGYTDLRPDLLAHTNALKYIIAESAPYREVPNLGQGRDIPIYVQPMDDRDPVQTERNVSLALALSQQHGYRLSLQIHKWLGIP